MKLNGNFIFQGSEARTGIKDPTKNYYEAALLSGIEQLRSSCDQKLFNEVLPGIKPFTECNCVFSFNPQYNTLRLTEIYPVK